MHPVQRPVMEELSATVTGGASPHIVIRGLYIIILQEHQQLQIIIYVQELIQLT